MERVKQPVGKFKHMKRLNLTGTDISGTKDELKHSFLSRLSSLSRQTWYFSSQGSDYRRMEWSKAAWLSFVTEELPERKGLEILRLAGNPSRNRLKKSSRDVHRLQLFDGRVLQTAAYGATRSDDKPANTKIKA